MSLVKQLWIAIIGLMILVFFTSFFISTYSAKSYYIEQLNLKNSDNANSLALMLSQMEKDEVMVELLIAAQFDTGNYKRIELLDPNGDERLSKTHEVEISAQVPQWFKALIHLKVGKGIAQVQDGWQQYGTLIVESDDRFAYESLWKTMLQFLMWFFVAALILGAIGTWVLRILTSPLEDVVKQAEAIGGRRFITSEEPKTLEFNRLVRAMNTLSARVRTMLENESRRLEEMRYKNQHDALTGFANREFFVSKLESVLANEDKNARNAMIFLRVANLVKINQSLGHEKTDALLKGVAEKIIQTIRQHDKEFDESTFGRLSGTDFAIMLSNIQEMDALAKALEVFMATYANTYKDQVELLLPMAASSFKANDSRQNIFQKMDALLVKAENEQQTLLVMEDKGAVQDDLKNSQQWRELLEKALDTASVVAQLFPVVDIKNRPLHHEAMMRLKVQENTITAGEFLPWARRFDMLPQLDMALTEYLLDQMKNGAIRHSVAVNLAIETLKNLDVRDQLIESIKASGVADRLWLELPERAVMEDIGHFVEFCELVKPLGCKVGLDKAGSGFANISRLQEVGLDYIKIDSALIHNISKQDQETKSFVRGACTLGHSIGLQLIAEGIQDFQEINELETLGMDGATGPGVQLRN